MTGSVGWQRLRWAALGVAMALAPHGQAGQPDSGAESNGAPPVDGMITGIGGFFFRARDPDALAAWYRDNLGIDPVPTSYQQQPWEQRQGPTVFAPFHHETDYFGDAGRQWMINFRVRDLDALVAALEARGVTVTVDPTVYPNGRFARLTDPEGNPIQLWEAEDPPPP